MSLPYFPMFPADFEAKTSHLSLLEDGVYNRLLRICWMTPGCSIPADDEWIMRRVRATSEAERAAVKAVLGEFFTKSKGRLLNKRLSEEFASASASHARRVAAGSGGGKSKSLKKNIKTASNALALPTKPEPEPEPEPDKKKMSREDGAGQPKIDEAPRKIFLREKILKALDADPISGQLGPTRRIGSTADMAEVARWLALPGITEDVVAQEVQRIADSNPANKPRSFKYFTPVFQQLSGALAAPPLKPSQPTPNPPPPPGPQRATPPPTRNAINPDDYDAQGRRIRPAGSKGRPE